MNESTGKHMMHQHTCSTHFGTYTSDVYDVCMLNLQYICTGTYTSNVYDMCMVSLVHMRTEKWCY